LETNLRFPFDTFTCSNGQLSVFLSSSGGGFTSHKSLALTRWYPDPTRDAEGYFFYLQDMASQDAWSLGFQPLRTTPEHYEVVAEGGMVRFSRTENGIASVMEVFVSETSDVEIRRITLTNQTNTPRSLRLTSYAEVVLNTRMGDVGHPAFSKLFVQTEWDTARGALLANRRLRSPSDDPGYMAHWIFEQRPDAWESDRMRFVGRGRTLENPLALGQALSCTTGNVLDAVFSLQKNLKLGAGESVTLHVALAFATNLETLNKWMAESIPKKPAKEPALFSKDELEMIAMFQSKSNKNGVINTAPKDVTTEYESLQHKEYLSEFNGYGGFSEDGKKYILHTHAGHKPPLPWVNVISNDQHGVIISESGACYSWSANSRENRLTPWSNDPVSDPFGEALYLKDRNNGHLFSPLPGLSTTNAAFRVEHGFGYSTFSSVQHEIAQDVTIFVPKSDPLKIAQICLQNHSKKVKSLAFYAYHELVMGPYRHKTVPHIRTGGSENGGLWAENPENAEFSERRTFLHLAGAKSASVTTDRTAFLGRYGTMDVPLGLCAASLGNQIEQREETDPCLALETHIELQPGEEITFYVLFGQGENIQHAHQLMTHYALSMNCKRSLDEVRAFWEVLTAKIQIKTPDPALNLMGNGWLIYQNLSCRIMGRSAFYQSGGAFGYRDQLQDTGGMFYHTPERTRTQILLHAAHQFEEGDVLHWWHPPLSKGIRTRFSDDLLWLPYLTAFYVNSSGDWGLLDEVVGFKTAPHLKQGEDEVFVFAEDSTKKASLYEHAAMTIDRSLTNGDHGLPLMGTGDWNDGMNRVGRLGKGESVWLGFFLYHILSDWILIAEKRQDYKRVERYRNYQKDLQNALNTAGWDGAWYRRAYYDNGAPLGATENDECQIDTIAQAWSVISGAAPKDRAEASLEAMMTHLVAENEGIIRLLTPAFDQTPHDPGYIKGYLPGVRENGGQYTHAALWAVKALAEAGKGTLATRLLRMISPVSHTNTPEKVARYQTEPYVVAADVYGVAPHVGRGGWTWYTGSAGWMYRVMFESILGVGVHENKFFTIKPCIPMHWTGFAVQYQWHDGQTIYEIVVNNPDQVETGIQSAILDGHPCTIIGATAHIPIVPDAQTHQVVIQMGKIVQTPHLPQNGQTIHPENAHTVRDKKTAV